MEAAGKEQALISGVPWGGPHSMPITIATRTLPWPPVPPQVRGQPFSHRTEGSCTLNFTRGFPPTHTHWTSLALPCDASQPCKGQGSSSGWGEQGEAPARHTTGVRGHCNK